MIQDYYSVKTHKTGKKRIYEEIIVLFPSTSRILFKKEYFQLQIRECRINSGLNKSLFFSCIKKSDTKYQTHQQILVV